MKFDLINKFYYTNLKKLPDLKRIVLNFSCKTVELKTIVTHLLALKLITRQKGTITISKHSNLLLKIRKGNPTGCRVTLRKTSLMNFLCKNLNEILPKIKNFNKIKVHQKVEKNAFSFSIKDTLNFPELAEHYYLFNNLSNLNLSFITNAKTKKEMLFVLKSFQLPLKS